MSTLNQSIRLFIRAIKYRYQKDPDELRRLLSAIGPGDTVLDIGAHKGAYTYWLARRVGSSGRIHAFEPQPRLAANLRSVFASPRWSQISIHELALSDQSGDASLFRATDADSPGASLNASVLGDGAVRLTVATVTLDQFIESQGSPKVRAIKCDVEGHELSVFRGGRRLLERDRPLLYFECESRLHMAEPMEEVFRFLHTLNYHGRFFDAGKLRPLTEFDAAQHQRAGVKPYINNFFFEAT
ncbi:MAG: FkbM family methyltransferase [bacterium]|nr:FkbM family methyltransferase [bacterium]